ncbi:protoporphyrinogen oxidase [Agromyces sp. LHK192]|uniref:protoporphyrinogen oxidase n=1 Tax=Agromyces sp. LHK192 TaxID=2498704 RepID=UPI001F0C5900|nr:protoporphyrinogen oxidase [Agromyces sp. LHK192]
MSDVRTPSADGTGVGREERTADVVVVGGGVAGLVAALECARIGLVVTVLERESAPGGCVGRIELDGLTLDSGAESFATRGGSVAELLGELGLADDIVAPNASGAWLVLPDDRGGVRAAPLPKTGMLGIPANPLGDDVREIIGWRGAIRAYLDRVRPILKIGRAHSLGALVRQRMGRLVLDRLVTPISSGIYSSDPMDLDLDVVAPGLNEAMSRNGSLSGGVGELVETRRAGSAVQGLRGGMHRLVDALLAELDRFGVTVVTGADVTGLESLAYASATTGPDESPGWRATAAVGESALVVDAAYAIVATPARSSRALLATAVDGWADVAEWPDSTAVEIVTLVLDAPALADAPRGTGVLVAADAPGVAAKALTHSSAKWAWVAEAAGSRQVVRLSYGRAGAANPLDGLGERAVEELAVADAALLTGVPLAPAMLVASGRTVWRDAVSHAALGQRDRVRAVEEALAAVPGLEATGSWLSGTGLASVVPHARAAAERVRHLAVAARAGEGA